jgi:hypothetical protein
VHGVSHFLCQANFAPAWSDSQTLVFAE